MSKSLFQILVVSLLGIVTISCALGPVKREVEIWLIDEEELSLYRQLHDNKEQVIEIKHNRDMHDFMCIDKREYKGLYQSLIEKGD